MSEAMLETKDVAECLGLSVRRVRRLLSSKKLRRALAAATMSQC